MARRFDESSTHASRSLQIWLILIGAAHDRRTLTYGILAKTIGFKGAGTLAQPLGHVMHYCRRNGLPPLTVLVVNQETGLPGEGLTETDLNADREAVFGFDWYALVPPSPEELGAAFREGTGADRPVAALAVASPIRAAGEIPDDERTPNLGDDEAAAREGGAKEGAGTVLSAAAAPKWRIAKSLLALRDQVNAKAPARNKKHDGFIGDAAHAARTSDHNPWVKDGGIGVVTAFDITHDPGNGADAEKIAEAIRASRDPRVKYVIWNRRIANASPIGDAEAWAWRPYKGANPHDKHVHISVKAEKAAYDAADAWKL